MKRKFRVNEVMIRVLLFFLILGIFAAIEPVQYAQRFYF